jgi:Na+-transporting NADH:ubiquinone oxidoreductase subunit A
MSKVIKISRGKNIPLKGVAPTVILNNVNPATVSIKPTDFRGIVPKLSVKVGDKVKAGDSLFTDKKDDKLHFTAPVSGEISDIVRGERRVILEIRIKADSENQYQNFDTNVAADKNEIISQLKTAGLWACIIQRPFGIVADSNKTPKAIHISCFDSAPLGVDYNFTLQDEQSNLQLGVDVLSKLTDGNVHLNLHKSKNQSTFESVKGAQVNYFDGPHPSGLVGVQIHHIDPINKGDVVWTLNPQHLAFIGRFFATGMVDLRQKIALTGSALSETGYVNSIVGATIDSIVGDRLADENSRLVSGNVLTGTQVDKAGYLSFYHQMMSVIPEGNQYEFLGWLLPSYTRPTISNTLPISKFFTKEFKVNTNYHGEERAYVVTGQYDKVFPMDILPVPLIKSILAQDFDKMEKLGMYEVIEEDLALCEFVCTSKIEVQEIISDGIELMLSEL